MVTDEYIRNNRTEKLKKGDKVIMVNCHEVSFEENQKDWVCQTDSFLDKASQEVIFLEEYSGAFLTKYLTLKTE